MNWSRTAIECYERGCNCYGCDIQLLISEPCQMKKAVIELVKLYGVPKNMENYEKCLREYEIYLEKEAEVYGECEPEIIGSQDNYEYTNNDGQVISSQEYLYNCNECNETDCEHWRKYNE